MPAQLRQRVPWLSFCEDIIFTAYDPPTALRSAIALIPIMTPDSDPKIQNSPAVPSPTMDPGARKTVTGIESSSIPPFATVTQKTPSPGKHSDLTNSNSDRKQDGEMKEVSDDGKDPEKQGKLNAAGAPVQSDPAATNSQIAKALITNQPQSPMVTQTKLTMEIHLEENQDRKLLAPPSLRVQRQRRLLVSQIPHKVSALPSPATSSQPLQRLLQ